MTENKKVIIFGGGLVGSVCACYMAKRGYDVTIYEKREDIRQTKIVEGRSINLALSHRGRKALSDIGVEDKILDSGVPMFGRLLHAVNGQQTSVPYDPYNKNCNYSVGRNTINIELLEAAEKKFKVQVFFNHKLISCDFKKGTVTVENIDSSHRFETTADLIIGADGAFSKMRLAMQLSPLFQFNQEYIDHGYMELNIPASENGKMVPNHLHIWPRSQFMMIALPNSDLTWTVTLFMPFKQFELLNNKDVILTFFKSTFPDAVPLIGENNIVEIMTKKSPSPLVAIKCNPHHIGKKFLLIGDAAHAIVPFYGQGMNAGFEDCTILNSLLDEFNDDIPKTLTEYTKIRVKSAHAVSDLAMYNYIEMRDLCSRKSFRIRQLIDNLLFKLFPSKWIPLYVSVTYSSMSYETCLDNKKWQGDVLQRIVLFAGIFVSLSVILMLRVFAPGMEL